MSCLRKNSHEILNSSKTKLSEVQLLPGKLERDHSKGRAEKWAVKTKSEDEKATTKRINLKLPAAKEKQEAGDGRMLKIKSQESDLSELDCNRKCKACWWCCCCGCTCSNRPHTKSAAIQAVSADIRNSMLKLPEQLRVPTASGDMIIQSLSSGDNRQLAGGEKVTSSQATSKDITAIGSMSTEIGKKLAAYPKDVGPSPRRPPLDPSVQRSVSAVMRHLSPQKKDECCSCFSCYKKSPEVGGRSSKRKSTWLCCTPCKKRKTPSQESLTSNTKSPEFHPVSARKRKRTLRERLSWTWGRPQGKVPLKSRGCCGLFSRPKQAARPKQVEQAKQAKEQEQAKQPAKPKRSLGQVLCPCRRRPKDQSSLSKEEEQRQEATPPKQEGPIPKETQPKMGLCRKMCCCWKPGGGGKPRGGVVKQGRVTEGKRHSLPPPRPLTKPNLWKRIFCCKCQRTPDLGSRKTYGSKRGDMVSRASSLASFPKLEETLVEHTSLMKAAIPVLPICLAWTCLILNVFLPGTGTILSGFFCVCFGKPRFSVKDSTFARLGALCVNFVIGIGQMFCIIFCFVGWGWSIWWGVIMIRLARRYRRIKQAEHNPNTSTTLNQSQDAEHGP